MDRELAEAVFKRWDEGYPVFEGTLYKAAQVVGIDPQAALEEARFYTRLDSYLSEKRAMSPAEKLYFSAAVGQELDIEKTASAFGVSEEELIIAALEERNFVPDLEKLADNEKTMDEYRKRRQTFSRVGGALGALASAPGAIQSIRGGEPIHALIGAGLGTWGGAAAGRLAHWGIHHPDLNKLTDKETEKLASSGFMDFPAQQSELAKLKGTKDFIPQKIAAMPKVAFVGALKALAKPAAEMAFHAGAEKLKAPTQNLMNRATGSMMPKLAFLGMEGGPTEGPSMDPSGGGQSPQPSQKTPDQAQPPTGGPQPGAQVQQAQNNRVRPSPTAPMQVPPSAAGNLDQILQEAAAMEAQGQQEPPMGTEDMPPPPSPQQKLMSSVPNLSPEVVDRYAEKLQQLEQQTGIPVTDPKQVQKFVQQLEKADKKVIDEAIKQMAEQQQMEAQQQAGLGGGFGPAAGAFGGPPAGGAMAAAGGAGAPQPGGLSDVTPPTPPKLPAPPKMSGPGGAPKTSPSAITKVAEAARALAHAHAGR